MKKIKVLQVIGSMNIGGAETFLMNVIRKIDKEKFEFVLVCYGDESFDYEPEINKYNIKIKRIGKPNVVGYKKHYNEIKELIKFEKPDVVHVHTYYNSGITILAAKKCKVPVRITHSHSTKSNVSENLIYKIYTFIMKRLINSCSNVFLACGKDAGKALFDKKNKFEVIYNGIDVDKFIYNEEYRKNKRNELKINDDIFLIGHVGRYCPVKNHMLLIDIFEQYLKVNNDAKLVLIGDGEERVNVEEKIQKYDIQDKVIICGKRLDVNELYNAMDLFLFPSLFEGFPVTLIETQINGLQTLASNVIDGTVKQTNFIEFFDINQPIENIIELIEKNRKMREINSLEVEKFDINNTIRCLEKYYVK